MLKKWLSYREGGVLGRALKPDEVQHFTDTAQRIAGNLALMWVGCNHLKSFRLCVGGDSLDAELLRG